MVTQSFLREVRFHEVVGTIQGGGYFRGFIAFEKLRYYARFKVAEASVIKQPCPQGNFKNIAKRYAGDEVDIKGL